MNKPISPHRPIKYNYIKTEISNTIRSNCFTAVQPALETDANTDAMPRGHDL